MLNIFKEPISLEPVSQRAIVFRVISDLATQSDFKYGWETVVNPTYSVGNISLGKRFFNPDDDYSGIFTPHTQLENYLGLNIKPDIYNWTPCTQSLTFYNNKLYESYNPSTFFYEITEDLGINTTLNPTFSDAGTYWELDLKNFNFYTSELGVSRAEYVGNSISGYDGKLNQEIQLEANKKYLVRVKFRLYSRFVKMRLQINADDLFDFKDFGFYQNDTSGTAQWEFTTKNDDLVVFQILALTLNNTIVGLQVFSVELFEAGNFVKLLFNDGHPFQVGDEIRINKTDKTINPQYDGFTNITDTTTYSVTTDLIIGERSVVPQTGFIINLTRNSLLSPTYWVFNGRRLYEEKDKDFNQYVLTGSASKFLSDWEHPDFYKRIKLNEYETLSLIINTSSTSGNISEKVVVYNGDNNEIYYLDANRFESVLIQGEKATLSFEFTGSFPEDLQLFNGFLYGSDNGFFWRDTITNSVYGTISQLAIRDEQAGNAQEFTNWFNWYVNNYPTTDPSGATLSATLIGSEITIETSKGTTFFNGATQTGFLLYDQYLWFNDGITDETYFLEGGTNDTIQDVLTFSLADCSNRLDIPAGPANFNIGITPSIPITTNDILYTIQVVDRGLPQEGIYEVTNINSTQPSTAFVNFYTSNGNAVKTLNTTSGGPFSVRVYGVWESNTNPYQSYEIYGKTFSSGSFWSNIIDDMVNFSSTASFPSLSFGYANTGYGYFVQASNSVRCSFNVEIKTVSNSDSFTTATASLVLDDINTSFSNLTPSPGFYKASAAGQLSFGGKYTRLYFQIKLDNVWTNQTIPLPPFTGGTWTASTTIGDVSDARSMYQLPGGVATASISGDEFPDIQYTVNSIFASASSEIPLSELALFIIDKECYEYEPIRVCWKNSLGGTDYFTFRQKNTWNSRIVRDTYRKNLKFDYNIGDRGETVVNETIERFWSITSDYLSDVEALFIQSMFESPEVYIMSNDKLYGNTPFNLIPVIVQTTQYDYKSGDNGDELIEYTIELKESVTKYINI